MKTLFDKMLGENVIIWDTLAVVYKNNHLKTYLKGLLRIN